MQSGAALGTPVRPPRGYSNTQHAAQVRARSSTPTCCRHEVVLVKREIQITICLLQTRECTCQLTLHLPLSPTPKRPLFTVHEISVSVNMCFHTLNNMISRFARSNLDFPNLGIRKLCRAKRFINMIMWLTNSGLDAV